VLVDVVDRLRSSLRMGDDLARMGGDEFTVLLRNVPDAATAAHVAERLLDAMLPPFDAGGHAVELGCRSASRWPARARPPTRS
jgi:GGDEF domain-containing protein